MFNLEKIIRDNIKALKPYSSARSEFTGSAHIFLDANENSFGSPLPKSYNRYPDPLQRQLKARIVADKPLSIEQTFLGNGSDECIDLLFRAVCRPEKDNVIICPPTYGMYEVSANINAIEVRKAPLTADYQLQPQLIRSLIDRQTKMIFICSPNNPSGNLMSSETIHSLLDSFEGLVVVDEAYIHFSEQPSFINQLKKHPNLVVLQTFSKAWGMAALRLGMLFGSKELVAVLNKIKPPYNINQATQELGLEAFKNMDQVTDTVQKLVRGRKILETGLKKLASVEKVYPSEANFVLVKIKNADQIYHSLVDDGIIVRNRSKVTLCEDCLRITVGKPEEDQVLIETLKNIHQ